MPARFASVTLPDYCHTKHYTYCPIQWRLYSSDQRIPRKEGQEPGMTDRFPPPEMKMTQEEMDIADIPYHFRDYCAHMWVDYKECRTNNPITWRKSCHHEVHSYNKCEYKEFKRRVAIAIEEKRRRGLM